MRRRALIPLMAVTLAAAGCSLADGGEDETEQSAEVVLVTHESFALPDDLIKSFEDESGYRLKVQATGDAGTLTNKLVLTKDDPTGDVAFGVDNTFASRALAEDVFADYAPADVPAGVAAYDLPGDEGSHLTPVDNGNVCVNIDTTWFAEHGVPEPTGLDDLTDPAYADLFVTPGASTSSPGLAFLLATIAKYGDGWPDYWRDLLDNGAEITDGWSDAYEVDFTQGGGSGDRPIVLSYDSSPAFTLADDGTSTTKALLDTCFTQVEYAGVLAGAKNPDGAQAFVDFLVSPQVQAALPDSMYVFPVADGTPLPADWSAHAERPTAPLAVAPDDIDAHRDEWLRTWSDLVSQ